MKKYIVAGIAALALLLSATSVYAVPVSWDASGTTLQPLQAMWGYTVRGNNFVATSTATSTLPRLSTSLLSVSGSAWLPGVTASSILQTDADNKIVPLTIGTGLTFDGTTLSASGGSGITALGPTGQAQTGPTITIATTSDTNLLLTVTGAGNTLTFTPSWTGTLAAGRLNANVVQGVTNDTNVTGSIAAQNLTLGWTGQLSAGRGGTGSSTLSGILKGNGTSAVQTAIAGTDYESPLSFVYPLVRSINAISAAFGTTTPNTWGAANNFTSTLGVGTTSPWALFSVNPTAGSPSQIVSVGSSSQTLFGINANGGVQLAASQPGTTTTITLDWSATPQQIEYQIGTAGVTINVTNATTSQQWGSTKRVWICNPSGTAGALSWTGVRWIGGSAPTQTTTANQCDLYSFNVTRATSTTAYIVAGAQSAGLQ